MRLNIFLRRENREHSLCFGFFLGIPYRINRKCLAGVGQLVSTSPSLPSAPCNFLPHLTSENISLEPDTFNGQIPLSFHCGSSLFLDLPSINSEIHLFLHSSEIEMLFICFLLLTVPYIYIVNFHPFYPSSPCFILTLSPTPPS